jgi:hypothetical protein
VHAYHVLADPSSVAPKKKDKGKSKGKDKARENEPEPEPEFELNLAARYNALSKLKFKRLSKSASESTSQASIQGKSIQNK